MYRPNWPFFNSDRDYQVTAIMRPLDAVPCGASRLRAITGLSAAIRSFVRASYQCTGRVATASFSRNNLDVRLVVLDQKAGRTLPDAPRHPHLLLQAIPTTNNMDALFQRVLAPDTSANSAGKVTFGEGALDKGTPLEEMSWPG